MESKEFNAGWWNCFWTVAEVIASLDRDFDKALSEILSGSGFSDEEIVGEYRKYEKCTDVPSRLREFFAGYQK